MNEKTTMAFQSLDLDPERFVVELRRLSDKQRLRLNRRPTYDPFIRQLDALVRIIEGSDKHQFICPLLQKSELFVDECEIIVKDLQISMRGVYTLDDVYASETGADSHCLTAEDYSNIKRLRLEVMQYYRAFFTAKSLF